MSKFLLKVRARRITYMRKCVAYCFIALDRFYPAVMILKICAKVCVIPLIPTGSSGFIQNITQKVCPSSSSQI